MTEAALQSGAMPEVETRVLPFQFNGSGKEYFGIWIVNILLTIVTLGIYSAWAKVRDKRYFNGNTELDGHRFDYHARPVQILIGRIIVVAVLLVIQALNYIDPFFGLGALAIYLIGLPWIIVRGLRFNANMTSYRNVRFHFYGKTVQAFVTYIVWPILALVSFLTLTPFASRSNARFLGNGHAYGTARFSANPPLKPYYKTLGLTVILMALVIGLVVAILYAIAQQTPESGGMDGVSVLALLVVLGPIGLIFMIYGTIILAFLIYTVHTRNIGFNNLQLEGDYTFRSTLTVRGYAWILATNLILIIVTLTLFTPWAKVRMARYLADNTKMVAASDLDHFVEGQIDETGVASGEFLAIEGIDFGF